MDLSLLGHLLLLLQLSELKELLLFLACNSSVSGLLLSQNSLLPPESYDVSLFSFCLLSEDLLLLLEPHDLLLVFLLSDFLDNGLVSLLLLGHFRNHDLSFSCHLDLLETLSGSFLSGELGFPLSSLD